MTACICLAVLISFVLQSLIQRLLVLLQLPAAD